MLNAMNRTFGIILLAVTTSLTVGCQGWVDLGESPAGDASGEVSARQGPAQNDHPFEQTQARLDRGCYLVEGSARCFMCHSDIDWTKPGRQPKEGRKGAGHIWIDEVLPWLPQHGDLERRGGWLGLRQLLVVSPNITPDRETGAGDWSDDVLVQAIRQGIGHDGRVLYPGMPHQRFRQLSDEDLASIIVYLRSIPAVRNPLPVTVLPAEIRESLQPSEPITEPVLSPDLFDPVEWGAYLVGLSDCTGCHNAFDQDSQPIPGLAFSGGALLKESWGQVTAPNITPDPSGISYYDEDLFVQVMRTGWVGARQLKPIMPWSFYGNMTDEDLKAIFAYLRALDPIVHWVDNTEPPSYCKLCGGTHGLGNRND
jgi:hypothetical protein